MIWQALNQKLRARGPLAFAGDVFELGVAIGVLSAGMLAGAVVVLPLLVWEYASEGARAAEIQRGRSS